VPGTDFFIMMLERGLSCPFFVCKSDKLLYAIATGTLLYVNHGMQTTAFTPLAFL
jgi:hypothetical protein